MSVSLLKQQFKASLKRYLFLLIEILTIHIAQRIVYRAFSLSLQLKILDVDKTASKWLLKQRDSK